VTPTVVASAIFLTLALFSPAILGSEPAQLALIVGLPPAVGWLVFQGPLLALASKGGYLRTLWARLPHALIAANLGLAGIHAIATPLINLSLRACSILPTPGWAVGILWAVVVGGALASGMLLFLYQLWVVKRGLSAWYVVAREEGVVRSGTWRTLWWWVLLSYLVLLGGVVASAVLQQLVSA
jgi:hypothetical protein